MPHIAVPDQQIVPTLSANSCPSLIAGERPVNSARIFNAKQKWLLHTPDSQQDSGTHPYHQSI
jgi:hypothetical protein